MTTTRRGFTLVELLVVTVLGSIVVLVSLQILITNQRTYTAQSARIQGQQTTRAALDILTSELREISAQGGDLLALGPDSVTIRTVRKFGVTCSVSTSNPPQLTVLRVGSFLADDDSVFVFADNNTTVATDDAWIAARVTAADTTQACGGQPAARLSFAGQGPRFTADSVRVGAPVRSFTRYTYGLYQIDGVSYLGRRDTGPAVPLVGPVRPTDGVAFRFMDANGTVTNVPTNVRQIAITVRTASGVQTSLNTPVADSITARIYTRN